MGFGVTPGSHIGINPQRSPQQLADLVHGSARRRRMPAPEAPWVSRLDQGLTMLNRE